MPLVGQGLLVGDGLLHHPAGDVGDGAGLFGKSNEAVRGHHPVLGVVPADKGLDRIDLTGAWPELGLVVQIELVALQRPVEVPHQLHAFRHGAPLLGAEPGDLRMTGLGPGEGHGGVLDYGVVALVDLGVPDRDLDIYALVGDLERRLQLSPRALQNLLGLVRAGRGEQDLNLGASHPAQPHLRDVPGQAAAEDLQDLAGQLRTQLTSQLAEAAQAHDGDEQLLLARAGIGGRDAFQQGGAGGIFGGQGRGQSIGDGVERLGAIVARTESDCQVARRQAAQGVGDRDRRIAGARLGRVGAQVARAASYPGSVRGRLHGSRRRLSC